jgi:hypothetical protein
MDVAGATMRVSQRPALMTINGGQSAVVSTATESADVPATKHTNYNHIPIVGFSYDREASRLILLYRDPSDGKVVTQIPTQVAVQSYQAMQGRASSSSGPQLRLIVGGADSGSEATGQEPGSPTVSVGVSAVTTTTAATSSVAAMPTVSGSQGVNVVV